MEKNQQPVESVVVDPTHLDVHSQWNTIQGEGPYAGHQATFIRLAGCTLMCPGCDTDYTSNREKARIRDIVAYCENQSPGLVVITGGEPFRQKLDLLCLMLLAAGKTVQIETNGTVWQPIPDGVSVICSPKTANIDSRFSETATGWKFIIKAGEVDDDGLPLSSLWMKQRPARPLNHSSVYLQPMDEQDEEQNKMNTRAAVESCEKFGFILCLQLHKIVGLA